MRRGNWWNTYGGRTPETKADCGGKETLTSGMLVRRMEDVLNDQHGSPELSPNGYRPMREPTMQVEMACQSAVSGIKEKRNGKERTTHRTYQDAVERVAWL